MELAEGSRQSAKWGSSGANRAAETALADADRLRKIQDERGLVDLDLINASLDDLRRHTMSIMLVDGSNC